MGLSYFYVVYRDDNCHYEKFADGTVKNIEDEIPFELPDGWCWCRLGTMFLTLTGNTPSTQDTSLYGNEYPFYKPADLDCGFYVESSKDMVSKKGYNSGRIIPIQSILVTCIGATIGKIGFVRKTGICNQQINALLANSLIHMEYFYYLMCSEYMQQQIKGKSSATTLPILNKSTFDTLLLAVPPITQQIKISNFILNLTQDIESIEHNKRLLMDCISATKSKILDLAIQGKLVLQDENDEPASVLLERIRAEKKVKLGKKYVESYIYKGDDNCYYENNNENPIKIPFNLPKNWEFSRLFNLAWLEDSEKNKGELLPYLDAKTLRGKQELVMVSEGKIVEARTKVILVDGENSGEVFEVPFRGYIGSTFKVLQVSNFVEKEFVKIILDFYKTLFKDNKTGSAIPHLNKKIFKSLIVGVPPINEQKRIISKVNAVMLTLKDEI